MKEKKLNREQRRRIQKGTMDMDEVVQILNDTRVEALTYSGVACVYCAMLCLIDLFDFGETRLNRFAEKYKTLFDDMCEERLSLNDVKDAITEKYNITID